MVTVAEFKSSNYKPHFRLLSREELENEPEAEWLIEGLYLQDSFAEIFAEPDSYKSFFAIDMACSVATGEPFLESIPVLRTGDVVYVYGEGSRGINKRIKAWERHRGVRVTRLIAIPEGVEIAQEVGWLAKDIKQRGLVPVLIVIDTLARCFGGEDENKTQAMNNFIRGCVQLREAFPGCLVFVVHHCGWEGSRERGARTLQGALDTNSMLLRRSLDEVDFFIKKQKDNDFDPDKPVMRLRRLRVPEVDSIVLQIVSPAVVERQAVGNDERAFTVLCEAREGLKRAARLKRSGINKHTFRDVVRRLQAKGRVEYRNALWHPCLPAPELNPALAQELSE